MASSSYTVSSFINKCTQNASVSATEKWINVAFEQYYGPEVSIDQSAVRAFARELWPTEADRRDRAKYFHKKKVLKDVINSLQDTASRHDFLFVPKNSVPRTLQAGPKPEFSKSKTLNWNNFEVLTDFRVNNKKLPGIDFQSMQEQAEDGIVRPASGIFMMAEKDATEWLKERRIIPKQLADVLILVPETTKQPSWIDLKLNPHELQAVIQKRGTNKLEYVRAWVLNLTNTDYKVIPDEMNIVVDAPPTVDMCIEIKKQCADKALYKKLLEDPRPVFRQALKDLGILDKLVAGPFAVKK